MYKVLKKMRWRFIGAAMSAFTAVVVILLLIISLWNFMSITRQHDDILAVISENDDSKPHKNPNDSRPDFPKSMNYSPEIPYMIRYFAVYYNNTGELKSINKNYIASVSEDEAKEYADAVLKKGKKQGYYNNYRFLIHEKNGEMSIFFLNAERELNNIKTLLFITVIIAFISLIIVFVLLYFFSKQTIAPYVRNIETQKKFVTDAGHELKTPLTSISTSADLLAMEFEDNEWVKNIQLQSGKLSKLISNMITLSRFDEEHPFPEMSEFSLSEAVWEISEQISRLALAKGKTFEQEIEDNLVYKGNREAIQQMVSIMLDNAVKYSDDNGTIRLSVKKSHRKIKIKVFNTCVITDISRLDRLFDRFYRMDDSRSDKIGGYGIGLSIAQSVATSHGGIITVESKDGKSILFTALI